MSESSSPNEPPLPMPPEWAKLTPNQRLFLACLDSSLGGIAEAAKKSGLSRAIHHKWKQDCPEYLEAVRQLDGLINDRIMREFYRRGVEGLDEPVFYQGKQVATKKVYDTPALIALAKARMPKKFRENFKGHIQLDGGVDHHIRHEALLDPAIFETLINAANNLNANPDAGSSS